MTANNKDGRLFIKLTTDFPRNPKIAGLSHEAWRCLVEAIIYSRENLTDGFIAGGLAARYWSASALAELTVNDAQKPSLMKVETGYIIRDYAEHQLTKAEVETLREMNKAKGQAGGRAKAKRRAKRPAKPAANPTASQRLSPRLSRDREETLTGFPGAAPETRAAAAPNGAAPRLSAAALEDARRAARDEARRIADNQPRPPDPLPTDAEIAHRATKSAEIRKTIAANRKGR